MPNRSLHDPALRTPAAAQAGAAFHPTVVEEVATTVARDVVVVVGMSQNPFVGKARAALAEAGVPFTYLEYGSYFSQWKQRLALKMWSGWPTFPQVFVKGVLIGGFNETKAAIDDGSLKRWLEQGPPRA
jgi:monothiol glutaredoxin